MLEEGEFIILNGDQCQTVLWESIALFYREENWMNET